MVLNRIKDRIIYFEEYFFLKKKLEFFFIGFKEKKNNLKYRTYYSRRGKIGKGGANKCEKGLPLGGLIPTAPIWISSRGGTADGRASEAGLGFMAGGPIYRSEIIRV